MRLKSPRGNSSDSGAMTTLERKAPGNSARLLANLFLFYSSPIVIN